MAVSATNGAALTNVILGAKNAGDLNMVGANVGPVSGDSYVLYAPVKCQSKACTSVNFIIVLAKVTSAGAVTNLYTSTTVVYPSSYNVLTPQLTMNADETMVVVNPNSGTYGSFLVVSSTGTQLRSGSFTKYLPASNLLQSPNSLTGGYSYLYGSNTMVKVDSTLAYVSAVIMPDVSLNAASFI